MGCCLGYSCGRRGSAGSAGDCTAAGARITPTGSIAVAATVVVALGDGTSDKEDRAHEIEYRMHSRCAVEGDILNVKRTLIATSAVDTEI